MSLMTGDYAAVTEQNLAECKERGGSHAVA
jgi:hypothetical protein